MWTSIGGGAAVSHDGGTSIGIDARGSGLAGVAAQGRHGKLEAYAEAPVASTVLVFCFKNKKADGRLKAVKAISKAGVLFLSEKVRDYKLPEWISHYVRDTGLSISPQAAQILAEYLGNDLRKVVNELTKLSIVLPEGTAIEPEHIEQHIGISKDYNVFELQRALGSKDLQRAQRITEFFAANPKDHPVAMIMPVLNSFFSKVYAYHGLKTVRGRLLPKP